METADMPVELRLAAIIHLLSSSAMRGATANKTSALRAHLRRIVDEEGLNPYLKSTVQEVLAGWEAVQCHPESIAVDTYPMTNPGCQLH